MKQVWCLLVAIALCGEALAECKPIPPSELQQSMFVADAFGVRSTVVNPAGLSSRPSDDGAFASYRFMANKEKDELNYMLSMGRLAFGVHELPLEGDTVAVTARTYRANISIGGRILSIGTSNKIVEIRWPQHATRTFSVDAGLVFQPFSWFVLAALAEDLDKPEIEEYCLPRKYFVGAVLHLAQHRVKLLSQAQWKDHASHVEDTLYKFGVAIIPFPGAEFLVGSSYNPGGREQYFAMLQFPLPVGIRVAAGARMDDRQVFQRYSASLLIPLQTVSF